MIRELASLKKQAGRLFYKELKLKQRISVMEGQKAKQRAWERAT
jgi:hypothetical protein